MSARAEVICDGCGKRQLVAADRDGAFRKPRNWYARGDDDGWQVACSRECVEKVGAASGKTRVILPI